MMANLDDKFEPPHVVCRNFLTSGVVPGERTLDVGCGHGDLMENLKRLGSDVLGVEIDFRAAESCKSRGLSVCLGSADPLPTDSNTFDRIVCSVVVPYTDEMRAVTEWSRVIRPGGRVYVMYHGLGYGLHCLLNGEHAKIKFYGMRMLLNTLFYRLVRRRMPGCLGDTLCQRVGQLQSYYRRCGSVLEREILLSNYCGFPRFICHQISRSEASTSIETTL